MAHSVEMRSKLHAPLKARAGGRLVPLTKADSIGWTLELHSWKGHLGFADGSVSPFSNGNVGGAIKIGDATTNWLAVP
jgi:hypothetical protein